MQPRAIEGPKLGETWISQIGETWSSPRSLEYGRSPKQAKPGTLEEAQSR